MFEFISRRYGLFFALGWAAVLLLLVCSLLLDLGERTTLLLFAPVNLLSWPAARGMYRFHQDGGHVPFMASRAMFAPVAVTTLGLLGALFYD